jgi:hypothetical protein
MKLINKKQIQSTHSEKIIIGIHQDTNNSSDIQTTPYN